MVNRSGGAICRPPRRSPDPGAVGVDLELGHRPVSTPGAARRNRALVYGALTACVVAVYVAIVAGLEAAFQSQGNLLVSLLATGLIAVVFSRCAAACSAPSTA